MTLLDFSVMKELTGAWSGSTMNSPGRVPERDDRDRSGVFAPCSLVLPSRSLPLIAGRSPAAKPARECRGIRRTRLAPRACGPPHSPLTLADLTSEWRAEKTSRCSVEAGTLRILRETCCGRARFPRRRQCRRRSGRGFRLNPRARHYAEFEPGSKGNAETGVGKPERSLH